MCEVSSPKHPAKFTDSFIPIFANLLKGKKKIIDTMCGTGKICKVVEFGYLGEIYCNDLEAEWFDSKYRDACVAFTSNDARKLPFNDGFFDAIVTSPTYGNRMADSHNAKDESIRNTYTHKLGRKLTQGNTGNMQFGEKYLRTHLEIWQEAHRILCDDGLLIVNLKNHIRKGIEVDVCDKQKKIIMEAGFTFCDDIIIPVKSNRMGANADKRVKYEHIFVFVKSPIPPNAKASGIFRGNL